MHKERTETFTFPREIRVEPDCDEHIDVTDALKNLVVENGESQVRVTVKGSPNYAITPTAAAAAPPFRNFLRLAFLESGIVADFLRYFVRDHGNSDDNSNLDRNQKASRNGCAIADVVQIRLHLRTESG